MYVKSISDICLQFTYDDVFVFRNKFTTIRKSFSAAHMSLKNILFISK